MKYHINENIKAVILEEVEMARPAAYTAWFMSQLMKNKVNYQSFFGMLLQIAEVALTLLVSNA